MQTVLHYGTDRKVQFDLADDALLGDLGTPRGAPLPDLAAAVRRALEAPLEYPSLARCLTPGDRVVLALDEALPQSSALVDTTLRYLIEAGVSPDGLTVLQTQAAVLNNGGVNRSAWPDAWKQRIGLVTHDPADSRQFAYLATTEAGEGIFLNRALVEADVVVPVGCLRRASAAGYYGIHTPLFPAFANQHTLNRFRARVPLCARGRNKRPWSHEVDEVAWLLGVTFTLQVVPAGGEDVLHVVAGNPDAVRAQGRQLYGAAWQYGVPRRADLVVAAIPGGAAQQTWQNLGRTLATAAPLVEDGGTIAVCCELNAAPGRGVQHLADAESRGAALRQIGKDRPDDTFSALHLARVLGRARLYLLSGLSEELLEQLEIAPISAAAEITRLAQRHRSCIILANGPHVAVRVGED